MPTLYRPKINTFPLWKDDRLQGTTKALTAAGTVYSDEIYASSDRGYATLGLEVAGASTVAITISVQYKLPGTDTWSTAVTLASISTGANTISYFYRLDGVLGLNWFPNLPIRYKFVETGAGTATLKGAHVI